MKNKKWKIDSCIPVPQKLAERYTFLASLKIGQSVLFQKGEQPRVRRIARIHIGKGCYTIRTLKEGVRVWRTK